MASDGSPAGGLAMNLLLLLRDVARLKGTGETIGKREEGKAAPAICAKACV
jgi:hypothetical protein